MITRKTDLYTCYGIERPENAAGTLTCWVQQTAEKVSPARRRPAILILPGGAYRWTSPREAEPVALRFAARGYAAFVLDYSCAPHGFPVSLREAAMAMRFSVCTGTMGHFVSPSGISAGKRKRCCRS